jgi:hypothetical protein
MLRPNRSGGPSRTAAAPLPALAVEVMLGAATTFRDGIGLGWDRLHPRAATRCPDEALLALVCLLVLAERLGYWPDTIGVILVCLLAKPDGGWRPIGLLPTIIRWWMRAKLDVAWAWQTAHDRP